MTLHFLLLFYSLINVNFSKHGNHDFKTLWHSQVFQWHAVFALKVSSWAIRLSDHTETGFKGSHVFVRSVTESTAPLCHDLHHRNTTAQGIHKQPPLEEPSGHPRTEASSLHLNDRLVFEFFQRPEESLHQLHVKHRFINTSTSNVSLQPRDEKSVVTLNSAYVF